MPKNIKKFFFNVFYRFRCTGTLLLIDTFNTHIDTFNTTIFQRCPIKTAHVKKAD